MDPSKEPALIPPTKFPPDAPGQPWTPEIPFNEEEQEREEYWPLEPPRRAVPV